MAYSAGPAAPTGRTAEFSAGQTGTGMTASLLNQTSKINSQIPKSFDPASVLDAYQQPGFHPLNGNSSTDAARQLPSGSIPTVNGYSSTTYSMRYPSNLPTRLALN